MPYIDFNNITNQNNNVLGRAYKTAQTPYWQARNTDKNYVHVSSLLSNQCIRKYFYEYIHQDKKLHSPKQQSAYSQTIFKIGSTLEEDRVNTFIAMQPNNVAFFGTWRCACGAYSIQGAKTDLDKRFYNVCDTCGTTPNRYDEYQFKIEHIGQSGRPDFCIVTKENGKYILSIYEFKTVMKSDFVQAHKNNSYQSLSHIKQSSTYYWFFVWLSKKHPEQLYIVDTEGKEVPIDIINPVITILYMDKRDDRYEPQEGEPATKNVYVSDWYKGDPNYFYTYNALEPVEVREKDLVPKNMKKFDALALANQTYFKKDDETGKVYFISMEYAKELSNVSKAIKDAKHNNELPQMDIIQHPCLNKDGTFSDYKAKNDMECPFYELCKNNQRNF